MPRWRLESNLNRLLSSDNTWTVCFVCVCACVTALVVWHEGNAGPHRSWTRPWCGSRSGTSYTVGLRGTDPCLCNPCAHWTRNLAPTEGHVVCWGRGIAAQPLPVEDCLLPMQLHQARHVPGWSSFKEGQRMLTYQRQPPLHGCSLCTYGFIHS